jgi:hypothetical protein
MLSPKEWFSIGVGSIGKRKHSSKIDDKKLFLSLSHSPQEVPSGRQQKSWKLTQIAANSIV